MTIDKLEKLGRWVGTLAVLVGIFLVILQLRQNANLTEALLLTERIIGNQQMESAVLGENFSETLARIHNSPNDLTDSELYQYDAYVISVIARTYNSKVLFEAGLSQRDWHADVDDDACLYFNSPIGKVYLQSPHLVENEIITYYREVVSQCGEANDYLSFMRDRLK